MTAVKALIYVWSIQIEMILKLLVSWTNKSFPKTKIQCNHCVIFLCLRGDLLILLYIGTVDTLIYG